MTPVAVTALTHATSVVAGSYHTCATLDGGTARCWGAGTSGQLGSGVLIEAQRTPVAVFALNGATSITTGSLHSCATLGDGSVHCWGRNLDGALGNGSTIEQRNIRGPVAGIDTAGAPASGFGHSCALLEDDTLRCWGANADSQLGDGTATARRVPVPVVFRR